MKALLILIIFSIALGYRIDAQTYSDLISYRTSTPYLSTAASLKYTKLCSLYTNSNIKFIDISSLASTLDSGNLLIKVPKMDSSSLLFETEFLRYNGENDYEWHGILPKTDSSNDFTGRAVIISNFRGKFGQITIDTNEFIIDCISDSLTTISYNSYAIKGNFCGVDTFYDSSFEEFTRTNPNCKTRILMLYTTAAKNRFPDIEQRIETAFSSTMQALRNSRINNVDLSIEIAGIEELQNFTEAPSISTTTGDLQNSLDAEQLREDRAADILVIFADIDPAETIRGFATFQTSSIRYVGVSAFHATGTTFAHEIGHCFSAQHETCDADAHGIVCSTFSNNGFEHAHSWTWKKWFLGSQKRSGTLLFTGNLTNRVLNYSNPDVFADKGRTGIEEERDNARGMELLGCRVAELDNGDLDYLYASIISRNIACRCAIIQLMASAQGGYPGNYSYQWSYSYDGIVYTSLGTTASISFTAPCPIGSNLESYSKKLYVKLVVTDSANDEYTVYKLIQIVSDYDELGNPCESIDERSTVQDKTQSIFALNIYPNPATSEVTISFISNLQDMMEVEVLNSSGQTLGAYNYTVFSGTNYLKLPLEDLVQGLYILRIKSETLGAIKIIKLAIK